MIAVAELVGKEEWSSVNRFGRPFVVYKFAATLDGRIAAADGTSQWITSAESRAEVHLLRAGCQATLVGSGTQQADNPNLAVRDLGDARLDRALLSPERQPLRVIVDSNARTPRDATVLNDAAPTLIAVAQDADASHLERASAAQVMRVPRADRGGLDVRALLAALFERGIKGLFLEGGPTLAGAFVAAQLVDRVICYMAPALLGAGKAGLGAAGIATLADMCRLEVVHLDRVGPDVRIIARPERPRAR